MIREYPPGNSFFILGVRENKRRNVMKRRKEYEPYCPSCLLKQAAPPPQLPFSFYLPLFLVKKRSVCKFTSWEQQELWREVWADVAEWKCQGKSSQSFCFIPCFLWALQAGGWTHRYAVSVWRYRSIAAAWSQQMPALKKDSWGLTHPLLCRTHV